MCVHSDTCRFRESVTCDYLHLRGIDAKEFLPWLTRRSPSPHGPDLAWKPQSKLRAPRGPFLPKEHIDVKIPHTIVSGIPPVLRLRTRL